MSPRGSPFARKDEDTSAFYDADKECVMNRLNTSVPAMKKMIPHDHPSSVIPVSPDATINYKNAVNTKTTHIKPKILALTNFQKQPGRDINIYLNERTKNVILDNTKEQREKARIEARELRKRFPAIQTANHNFYP